MWRRQRQLLDSTLDSLEQKVKDDRDNPELCEQLFSRCQCVSLVRQPRSNALCVRDPARHLLPGLAEQPTQPFTSAGDSNLRVIWPSDLRPTHSDFSDFLSLSSLFSKGKMELKLSV